MIPRDPIKSMFALGTLWRGGGQVILVGVDARTPRPGGIYVK
jgi:hypothetical protein